MDLDSLREEIAERNFLEGFDCGMLAAAALEGKPEVFLEELLKRRIPYHQLADLVQLVTKLLRAGKKQQAADELERSLEASLNSFSNRSNKRGQ